uniref:Uncharacterized protein n=1 Tax=Streptomyces sp. RM-5-8 TaxID=1429103 RepID=A0A1R7T0M5_9ACTN|nr:hypothetical protein [Streptomyces sp. RM-5-8]
MKGVNGERNFPFISTHPPRPIHRPGRMPGYLMAAPTAGPMAPPLPREPPPRTRPDVGQRGAQEPWLKGRQINE